MGKQTVILLCSLALFLIGTYTTLLEPSLVSYYKPITCDCANSSGTNSSRAHKLKQAPSTIKGFSELRYERILVELTNMKEKDRNSLLSQLKRNMKMQNRNLKIKIKSDYVNGSRIVYDEYELLKRLQELHDSRYTPPIKEKCKKRMPQCVILGMKKCGTQELIDFLTLHPNIVRRGKPVYEIGCFESKEKMQKCKPLMPCSYSDQITITKNSAYFTMPSVLERLREFNKTLKMIVLVREPVERLISDYSFEYFQKISNHGQIRFENNSNIYRKMKSLDDGLKDKLKGRVNTSVPEVNRSMYDIPMKRFLKLFRRDQLLVIESKEMKSRPFEVLQKVETFLGLEHMIERSDLVFNSDKGFYCVKSPGGMKCYGDNRGRSGSGKLKISEETKRILHNHFKPHNENFFRLIGERFDW